ncbi:sulfate adenylyltransferase subunit 1 [Pontibacter ummariensis]|uniref:sulfate adenylyltransferase n=1 Tax=Pontibacter ummariensis TaxID=1610492 RepID=A0A239IP76_9BACT|nr:GTP-binding protein [Pontibacter ummariensis]PRY09704.1 sulfate adenylyltransferase subunit 1 [Pontibacter ummariensis]SNS95586.1 sulfate adenylyltransferase subunit 1 [Pontibacter ummariensis]
MDILRFITAGSVDDGKSTLIGRLLYDTKQIYIDQLEAIESSGRVNEDGQVDLSLLTDGLKAEREQGITIDVAYKYFSTPKRKFIIADAPGHVQYTRNMVTGASNSNLSIILVDARKGVQEQTRRHSIISSLLGIPHLVICINKMDLVGFDETVYNQIVEDYKQFAKKLNAKDITFIPISALKGDNVVDRSVLMPWYNGPSLLEHLEQVPVSSDFNLENARFPVQYVIRPHTHEHHDYRGYAGKVISGTYRKGDKVTVLPSGLTSTIKSVELGGKELEEAFAPMSVVLQLEDDVDISRGDVIVKEEENLEVTKEFEALVCWMNNKPLKPGAKLLLRHNSTETRAIVRQIQYKVDVNGLDNILDADQVQLNDICRVQLKTATPLLLDKYEDNRANGGFILVDETSFTTVGAGMVASITHESELNYMI